jgi:hypothetical protein
VQVDVENGLTSARVDVEYCAPSLLMDAGLLGYFSCCLEHVSDERTIFRGDVVQCGDVLSGTHENVNRSFRTYILKCHDIIIFVDQLCRYLAPDDSTEEA